MAYFIEIALILTKLGGGVKRIVTIAIYICDLLWGGQSEACLPD
jgi:hypothetical protein